MFFVWLLYILVSILVIFFMVAWLMMPFELRAVNKNLEEIKELLVRQSGAKKAKKTAGCSKL